MLRASASSSHLQDRLEHLRKQCGPHVSAAAKDSVEGICSKIYHISLEYVKRIREKHLAILKEHSISGSCQGGGRGASELSVVPGGWRGGKGPELRLFEAERLVWVAPLLGRRHRTRG